MDYLPSITLIAGIHLLAVMSPGPDFFMAIRNALVYSRMTGILFAFGLSLGVVIHYIYSLFGLNLIITKSIILFSTIKFLGAGYLIFLGIKALTSKGTELKEITDEKLAEMSPMEAIGQGFLTNLLNPKAVIYFLSLFTQFISADNPWQLNLIWGIEVVLITFLWFSFVTLVLSHNKVRSQFLKVQKYIDKLTGGILILFGLKIITSKIDS